MSDSQSWYARKFAQMRGGQPAPAPPQRPYNAPGYAQTPYPPQYPQQAPNGYQQPQQWPQQPPQYEPPPPPVTIDNLWGAMHHWKGGPAHKTDREPCPNCGSNQYFSRAVSRHGPPPAPHCYNCGYNDGLFTQGEPTTWGMTA